MLLGSVFSICLCILSSALAKPSGNVLRAVPNRHTVARRDIGLVPSLEKRCVHYAEDRHQHLRASMRAEVEFTPSLPAILLEDFDSALEDFQCTYSGIAMRFLGLDNFRKAKASWSSIPEFFLISSHHGCNENGHRLAYRVSKTLFDDEHQKVYLTASPVSWREMARDTKFGFGRDVGPGSIKHPFPHADSDMLRKRQVPTPTVSSSGASETRFYPTSPYPEAPTNTPPAANDSTKNDFSLRIVNKTILPPEVTNGTTLDLLSIPNTIFKCTNCSTSGQIELNYGAITEDGSYSVDVADQNPLDFIDRGFFQLDLHKFQANIDLETIVGGNIPVSTWSVPLPSVPLTPFAILGVASIGPVFTPYLEGSIQSASALSIKYGFDLSLPDNTQIQLNINSLGNSTMRGFNQTSIKAHPISTNVSEPKIKIDVAFRPQIDLGISIADSFAGVAFYASVPRLQLEIEQVSGVNRKCEKSSSSPSSPDQGLGFFSGNLTHLVPSVNFEVGVVANFDVPLLESPINDAEEIFAATNVVSLPTSCLSWNSKQSALTTIDAKNTGQPNPPDADATTTSAANGASASKVVPAASATKTGGSMSMQAKLSMTLAFFSLTNLFAIAIM